PARSTKPPGHTPPPYSPALPTRARARPPQASRPGSSGRRSCIPVRCRKPRTTATAERDSTCLLRASASLALGSGIGASALLEPSNESLHDLVIETVLEHRIFHPSVKARVIVHLNHDQSSVLQLFDVYTIEPLPN